MMWKTVWIVSTLLYSVNAECGYDCDENSIETSGDGAFPPAPGLPPSTVLGGKVVKLDDIASLIFLNRTKASLNCATGVMQIDLKFEEPFNGIVYADFDRSSSCSILGDGETTAKISLPLTGCGTKQDPVRVFTNNLIVRFHPALEMDGDEIITIVCRYPPPVAPPPPPPAAPLKVTPTDLAVEQPLKGFQILLIICGILFLSLVLFGLSVSYYCLKNQRIRVVRRYPTKDEESLKGSGSSVGTLSMFDTLKIPRAHTLPVAGGAVSSTASETAHGSETLPSDYPSETPSTAHSEAEDADSRRRSISSGGSFENKAYVPDVSILTQEQLLRRNETEVESHETTTRFRPPPPEPKFDVQMRIKKPPLPPPSPSIASSSSDTDASLLMERNLLTIDEREENTIELRERGHPPHTFVYRPEIHSPPKSQSQSPPIYSEVMRRNRDKTVPMPAETWRSEHGIDITDDAYEETEQHEEEMTESKYAERYYQRALSPIAESTERARTELSRDVVEPPLVPSRRPEITSHIVDDVFLRTITEKKTIEDIERHRRQVTDYKQQLLPAPKWDVVIRNYPNPNDREQQSGAGEDTATDWESFSESSSIYGVPPATATSKPDGIMYRSQMDVEKQYSSEIPMPDPPPQNWSTLVSVLNYPDSRPLDDYGEMTTFHRTEKSLSVEDKRKWRKIITTESTLRTLLTEASVREDYERIRRDDRYENLFEPDAWDVIIRILSPRSATSDNRLFDQRGGGAVGGSSSSSGSSNRYRKKAEWDSRSNRRNSLPTLYEYDSDGSSMRNVNLESYAQTGMDPIMRSRRTSRSSMRSDMDVRSMSEVTVDFARPDVPDNLSETSSYYRVSQRFDDDEEDEDGRSLIRSLSQPSLARSASEFTENWGIRGEKNWDLSSPEHSPRSSIRSKHSGNVDGASSSFNTSLRSRSLYQSRNQWYKETDRDSE